MLYSIIETFGPENGDSWQNYCSWRQIEFERFDSIDGMLRPNLFSEIEDSDWSHIVNENYMLHLITDLEFANYKREQIGSGSIVGVLTDAHDEHNPHFCGYDVIDKYWDVSLLTNWGSDISLINKRIRPNALLAHIGVAKEVHEYLLAEYSTDDHVADCQIVSIYNVC